MRLKDCVTFQTRALEIGAVFLNAAATRNPKAIAATAPSVKKFIHHRKGLYLGKIRKMKIIVAIFLKISCGKESNRLWKTKDH